jgi:hypothetical protein
MGLSSDWGSYGCSERAGQGRYDDYVAQQLGAGDAGLRLLFVPEPVA